jgi:hypothetical protein
MTLYEMHIILHLIKDNLQLDHQEFHQYYGKKIVNYHGEKKERKSEEVFMPSKAHRLGFYPRNLYYHSPLATLTLVCQITN